jgi:hypothetical protein
MIKKDFATNTISEKFTVEKTQQFQNEMNIAIKTMELMEVMKVLIQYNIIKNKESKEFLNAFIEMNEKWQKQNEDSVLVGEVHTRKSKCIACEFGKDMTVYEYQYKHLGAPVPYNRIVYQNEFGMLYDIKEGILHDIRICNAFLNKEEMHKLI